MQIDYTYALRTTDLLDQAQSLASFIAESIAMPCEDVSMTEDARHGLLVALECQKAMIACARKELADSNRLQAVN